MTGRPEDRSKRRNQYGEIVDGQINYYPNREDAIAESITYRSPASVKKRSKFYDDVKHDEYNYDVTHYVWTQSMDIKHSLIEPVGSFWDGTGRTPVYENPKIEYRLRSEKPMKKKKIDIPLSTLPIVNKKEHLTKERKRIKTIFINEKRSSTTESDTGKNVSKQVRDLYLKHVNDESIEIEKRTWKYFKNEFVKWDFQKEI